MQTPIFRDKTKFGSIFKVQREVVAQEGPKASVRGRHRADSYLGELKESAESQSEAGLGRL
jgi:hypothetical protein